MLNIFENDNIYGSKFTEAFEPRVMNAGELAQLNTEKPAEIFQGKWGLSCRMYIKGSTTLYRCMSLDTRSTLGEGELFDVTKCIVTQWKQDGDSEIKVKIWVTDEARI